MDKEYKFSKYEKARIIGARGLQISMDAPLLITIDENALNLINYDPLKIAEIELDSGVLPISVNRPMPKKKEESIKNIKIEDVNLSDAKKEQMEQKESKEIAESGDIMTLTDSNETSDDTNEPQKEISE